MICPRFEQGKFEELITSLPDESVDLIYTDPPYGMGYVSNIPGDKRWNKSEKTESKFTKQILNDKHGDIDFDFFAKETYRVLKPNTYLVLHCNTIWIGRNIGSFQSAGFKYKGTIAWNKRFAIGGDIMGAMKRDWEPILYLAKGKPKMRKVMVSRKGKMVERARLSEVLDWTFQLPKSEKTGFPTQKPKGLCKQVINLMTDDGQMVLDPFAGSGVIGKSASECGRESLSYEADPDVFGKFLKPLMGTQSGNE